MRTSEIHDGSAGDVDYAAIGSRYAFYRRADPRIAACIESALGRAARILNVGAGAGSYEPTDRDVTAVEPSATMRAQRGQRLSPAIDAVAEDLPFPDGHFDASMATFTIHQWDGLERGLSEMRRVTKGAIVILTCDPHAVQEFWLNTYAPEVLRAEAMRYPTLGDIALAFNGEVQVAEMPIPLDCQDGFNEAYYGRPERFFDPGARQACSAWSFLAPEETVRSIDLLQSDLATGRWDHRYGYLRTQPSYSGSLRLITSRGDGVGR